MKIKLTYSDLLLSHMTTNISDDDDKKFVPHLKTSIPDIRITEFNDYELESFSDSVNLLVDLGAPIIPVIVDSYGGQVYTLLGMIDIIESCPVPVLTYSTSKSMSCGAFLAAFGTKGYRYMSPHSTIMLHSISGFDFGKLEDMKSNVKEMDRLSDILFGKLDQVCGQEQQFFKALIKENLNADLYVNAEKAKEYGLVDHIAIPEVSFHYDLKTSFKVKMSGVPSDKKPSKDSPE